VFANAEEAGRWQKQIDLLGLIRDEVNVEEIVLETRVGLAEAWTAELNTEITPELKRKGMRREFSRQVMNLRKEAGLHPADRINVRFATKSVEIGEAVAEGTEDLKRDVRADSLEQAKSAPELSTAQSQVEIGGEECGIFFV
jgi:valyl-tRNA synthetase